MAVVPPVSSLLTEVYLRLLTRLTMAGRDPGPSSEVGGSVGARDAVENTARLSSSDNATTAVKLCVGQPVGILPRVTAESFLQ